MLNRINRAFWGARGQNGVRVSFQNERMVIEGAGLQAAPNLEFACSVVTVAGQKRLSFKGGHYYHANKDIQGNTPGYQPEVEYALPTSSGWAYVRYAINAVNDEQTWQTQVALTDAFSIIILASDLPDDSPLPGAIQTHYTVPIQKYTVVDGVFKLEPQSHVGSIIVHDMIPRLAIMLWPVAISQIPKGWLLCDGTFGTPDMRGKFVVGYNEDDADYDEIGKTGGYKSHGGDENSHDPISIDLDHEHLVVQGGGGGQFVTDTSTAVDDLIAGAATYTSTDIQDGIINIQPFSETENRPPYYVVAYIQRRQLELV